MASSRIASSPRFHHWHSHGARGGADRKRQTWNLPCSFITLEDALCGISALLGRPARRPREATVRYDVSVAQSAVYGLHSEIHPLSCRVFPTKCTRLRCGTIVFGKNTFLDSAAVGKRVSLSLPQSELYTASTFMSPREFSPRCLLGA